MLKRYFILSKLGLYQEWKISSTLEKSINVFYHNNILMEKNHVFISIDAKNFVIFHHLGKQENFLNPMNATHKPKLSNKKNQTPKQTVTNMIFDSEMLKHFL